jgi:hypothetical protein
MSNVIKLFPKLFIPRQFIKEELDRHHRQDWDDPDRYVISKEKALRYIPVRAPDIEDFDWERLVREIARVFHDDLKFDPEIHEAAQRACWEAEHQHHRDEEFGLADLESEPELCGISEEQPERGSVRGVDTFEETLANLEWQRHEEETEP